MNLLSCCFTAFFFFMAMSQPASAAASASSYSKSVRQGGTVFDISSRPAGGSAVQIVTVTVRSGGRKVASVKADVDYLPRSAQAVDLTGDGRPELAVISRTSGGVAAEALDVYWLDGATLHRVEIPELDEKSGYRGGDRFHLEGRLIVRTVPLYREGDFAGKPTGGTRSLKYDFKQGAFALYVQTERAANLPDDAAVQAAPVPETAPPVAEKPSQPPPSAPAITEIAAVASGIEIRAGRAVEKFRIVRLDKPERIAVDIPDADSSLAGKKIPVNRFGISTVRVGRNKGFLRVVLDTSLKKFPQYSVKSSDAGVLIEFPQ